MSDSPIKEYDPKTDSLLLPLAAASMACYADNVIFAWEGEGKTSHLLHTKVNDVDTFSFAGTFDDEEWLLDIFAVPVPVPNIPQVGDLHAGFAIGACAAIYQYILPTLKALNYPKFYLSGHSKGAAQAGQAHGILKVLGYCPTETRLYEPPFFGGQMLADLMPDVPWTQTYNSRHADIVTYVPGGPSWKRNRPPIRLQVSDDADIITMHKFPCIYQAIQTYQGQLV
jgi:hypothetical protein